MAILKHELRQNRLALIIWSCAISFLLAISVLIYPEMSKQMGEMNDVFANMGSFSSAFGMDQLNFGEFSGYFGIECGNTLGLGGAFFAAILGISLLAKEEHGHTADFLFAHPISRTRVLVEKLLAMVIQILFLNLFVIVATTCAALAIGETPNFNEFYLLLIAFFILQLEIGFITFGISAFLKGNGIAIGLGLSFVFYFLNILANLTEDAKFLKYITPYGYTDAAPIISNHTLEWKYLAVGCGFALLSITIAFIKYRKKDLA